MSILNYMIIAIDLIRKETKISNFILVSKIKISKKSRINALIF